MAVFSANVHVGCRERRRRRGEVLGFLRSDPLDKLLPLTALVLLLGGVARLLGAGDSGPGGRRADERTLVHALAALSVMAVCAALLYVTRLSGPRPLIVTRRGILLGFRWFGGHQLRSAATRALPDGRVGIRLVSDGPHGRRSVLAVVSRTTGGAVERALDALLREHTLRAGG